MAAPFIYVIAGDIIILYSNIELIFIENNITKKFFSTAQHSIWVQKAKNVHFHGIRYMEHTVFKLGNGLHDDKY